MHIRVGRMVSSCRAHCSVGAERCHAVSGRVADAPAYRTQGGSGACSSPMVVLPTHPALHYRASRPPMRVIIASAHHADFAPPRMADVALSRPVAVLVALTALQSLSFCDCVPESCTLGFGVLTLLPPWVRATLSHTYRYNGCICCYIHASILPS